VSRLDSTTGSDSRHLLRKKGTEERRKCNYHVYSIIQRPQNRSEISAGHGVRVEMCRQAGEAKDKGRIHRHIHMRIRICTESPSMRRSPSHRRSQSYLGAAWGALVAGTRLK
jgi:hypothetical protein